MTVQRRFAFALLASIALHAVFLGTTREPRYVRPGEPGFAPTPLTVRLVEAFREAPPLAEPVLREPVVRERVTRPHVTVPRMAQRHAAAQAAPQIEAPAPTAPPERTAQTRFDMAALIDARRAQRRAAEQSAAHAQEEHAPADPGAAAIQRNLMMSGDDGVGGIFEILYKGTATAQYAFNGWRPDTHRQWREVIEVTTPAGGDIDRAIVHSMIQLIRSHYDGDFRWDSRRLGRVVTLSARIADNGYLEEFLMREFFGTPLIREARPR